MAKNRTVTLTPFQSVTNRLMHPWERDRVAKKLKLGPVTKQFIEERFTAVCNIISEHDGITEDDVSDSQGRACLQIDYDDVESDLAGVMQMPDHPTKKQTQRVDRIMEAFFFE
jgi:hypothetical protein